MDIGGIEARSWEPRLWEEPQKTTEGSPGGVAPSAGRQMPSIGRLKAICVVES